MTAYVWSPRPGVVRRVLLENGSPFADETWQEGIRWQRVLPGDGQPRRAVSAINSPADALTLGLEATTRLHELPGQGSAVIVLEEPTEVGRVVFWIDSATLQVRRKLDSPRPPGLSTCTDVVPVVEPVPEIIEEPISSAHLNWVVATIQAAWPEPEPEWTCDVAGGAGETSPAASVTDRGTP